MKNSKITLFALSALLLLFLSSCSTEPEALESFDGPQARQVVSTHTFHSLMPGTLQNVYQMDVTLFSDGTSEATRSIIPFNGNLDYSNYHFVGATNAVETPDNLAIQFDGEAWFIPFAPQGEPALAVGGGGGTVYVQCWCNSFGNCDAKVTWGGDGSGSADCVSRPSSECEGSCNADVNYSLGGGNNMSGVYISSHTVMAN